MDNFVAHGDRIRHTLAAAAVSGDLLLVGTGLIGVAMNDGALGEEIDVAIEGVFTLPKVSAAVIGIGESVNYDASLGTIDDELAVKAAGDFTCGWANKAAGNGVLTVEVKINTSPPVVT